MDISQTKMKAPLPQNRKKSMSKCIDASIEDDWVVTQSVPSPPPLEYQVFHLYLDTPSDSSNVHPPVLVSFQISLRILHSKCVCVFVCVFVCCFSLKVLVSMSMLNHSHIIATKHATNLTKRQLNESKSDVARTPNPTAQFFHERNLLDILCWKVIPIVWSCTIKHHIWWRVIGI